MQMTLIYIHGQYGSPEEAERYRPLFPGCEVIGFDYKTQTPWEAERIEGVMLDGENDNLTSMATISDFVRRTGATLEVMPGGEHWFHTPKQMAFLGGWIQRASLAAYYLDTQ